MDGKIMLLWHTLTMRVSDVVCLVEFPTPSHTLTMKGSDVASLVEFPREREKRDRRDSIGDKRESQEKKEEEE